MKKIFLFSLLVLAMAATAYSQDVKLDFRASGFVEVRTNVWRNTNEMDQMTSRAGIFDPISANQKPGGAEFNRVASYMDERGRLKFDAIMGKELSGTFFFEFDARSFGDMASGNSVNPSPGRNQIGFWSGDRAGLEVKNLYFDVAVPYIPVPITTRFGLQPFGVRPGVFMYVDGTGVTAAAKIDPVNIIVFWAKALEGRLVTSDDVDLYALHVNAKIDKVTVGGYALYQNARSYPLDAVGNTNQELYGTTTDSVSSKMWWLGAYVDGRLGPVDINFDFVYDTGDVKRKFPFADPAVETKVKYNGWIARLKVDFPWEAFNFGTVWGYGSGADKQRTDKFGFPGNGVADPASAAAGITSDKVSAYVMPIASEAQTPEGEVITSSYANGGYTGWLYAGDGNRVARGPGSGLWFAKLYGSYKVAPEFKVTLQGLYWGDTTKNGDTLGNSRNITGETLKNNSTIGWEADIIGEWQVYKNLTFKGSFGYLWPDNALKFFNAATGTNEKPLDPWVFFTTLTYNF